ncbi:YigZ family protein [Erysipelotrichaceae bacterium RD49]|nr:YigZ family protein [Erysipelotrichaceae bacterium RD49]
MYLKEEVVVRQEIKKSKFICVLSRIRSVEELKAFITRLKKEYPQASHYCSALKAGGLTHSSDDGEPSGTAGRPMLDVLLGSKGDEIGAVVIRYFGGTLLGKGGLVRAYSSSTALALENAKWILPRTLGFYQLEADYRISGKVESVLRSLNVEELNVTYGNAALYTFFAAEDPNPDLSKRFSGQIEAKLLKECQKED